MTRPVIAAFDLATTTGLCFGPVGGSPRLMTLDMRTGGNSRAAKFSWFLAALNSFFKQNHVDVVRYEQPLEVVIASKMGTSDSTITMLHGAVAVLEVAAYRANVFDIDFFTVQAARHHLTGQRTHGSRKAGKEAVMRACKMLKVPVANDNEGDAYAGWSYACGLANPRISHFVTPLFARAL